MRGAGLHLIGLAATLIVGVALWPRHAPPSAVADASAELLVKQRTTPQQRLRARLMIPVEGVTRAELQDTWGDARSAGRTHQGIDIMAAQGTRVQAVADGRIVKFFDSVRGGITIYQFDQTERFVYYYGHLNARAAGLMEGDRVRQGATIGYVGMTGNAPVPHLHFEIQRLRGTERHWWQADSMNPYPYLMTGVPPT
jgi:peptidoglycan LD-endopeptidase LytH